LLVGTTSSSSAANALEPSTPFGLRPTGDPDPEFGPDAAPAPAPAPALSVIELLVVELIVVFELVVAVVDVDAEGRAIGAIGIETGGPIGATAPDPIGPKPCPRLILRFWGEVIGDDPGARALDGPWAMPTPALAFIFNLGGPIGAMGPRGGAPPIGAEAGVPPGPGKPLGNGDGAKPCPCPA
jgi:hypothetical protein